MLAIRFGHCVFVSQTVAVKIKPESCVNEEWQGGATEDLGGTQDKSVLACRAMFR